jgi:hypothetical protein
MSKKDFKTDVAGGADAFFSTRDTTDTQNTQYTKPTFYRLNLKLSGELKQYLADEAWRQRKSITDLVDTILLEYKSSHESK